MFNKNIIYVLLVLVILVILQAILSKSQNKLLGLILPVISFLIALVVGFGGSFISKEASTFETAGRVMDFILYNIPTAIFIAVYVFIRKKYAGKA